MTFKFLVSLGFVACSLIGCANATFHMNEEAAKAAAARAASATPAAPQHEERQANFFSGFGQQHTINAAAVCGGAEKVATVDVNQSLMDAVIATVTLGIYTPLSARVYCK
jgi:Bor protein